MAGHIKGALVELHIVLSGHRPQVGQREVLDLELSLDRGSVWPENPLTIECELRLVGKSRADVNLGRIQIVAGWPVRHIVCRNLKLFYTDGSHHGLLV